MEIVLAIIITFLLFAVGYVIDVVRQLKRELYGRDQVMSHLSELAGLHSHQMLLVARKLNELEQRLQYKEVEHERIH